VDVDRVTWVGRTLGVVVALCLTLVAASSASASVTIGQTDPAVSPSSGCVSDFGFVQTSVGTAGRAYTVPSDGVLTQWSTNANSESGDTLKLKVLHLQSGHVYSVIAESGFMPITPSTLNTFAARLPVHSGDVIGLREGPHATGVGAHCQFDTADASDAVVNDNGGPDSPPGGSMDFTNGPFTKLRVNVSAVIEPDADRDGFGDETQDSCVGVTGSVQGCPKADLSITKAGASAASIGQSVTYTLTARNNGPDPAPGVVVSDALPAGASLVSATPSSGTCSGSSTLSCNLGTLASGATATVTLVVRMTSVGSKVDTATVGSSALDTAAHSASGAGDPNLANNSASATTAVSPVVVASASQTNKTWREPANPKLVQISRRRPPVGTTFKFTLSAAARVRFDFTQSVPGRKVGGRCVAQNRGNKRKRRCTRTVIRGSLSFLGHAGVNTVRFQGRVSSSKKLKPGKYTLVITTPGVGFTAKKLAFTIVKR
jgi:uncharacterized repeat protein (TIGR01451 family)